METVPLTIREYLELTGTGPEDYDVVVLHQANQFILKQITKRIKASREQVPVSLDRYGNTGGISIPLTLCDRYGGEDAGRIRALMSGFGIGLSWGVTSAELDSAGIFPIVKTSDYFEEGKFVPGKY